MTDGPTFRSELGRARGLGAAKDGVQHWWTQRLTALALVPLTIWFVASIVGLAGADHAVVSAWLGAPLNVGLMILIVGATFNHAQLSVQTVLEDYVHHEGLKFAAIILAKFSCLALALASVIALLVIAFGD
ncbi:MAG: succinate dehydrogenase, hydrophobic membrane anchor protein [Dongiaceae bacterium]